jgi:hypothetical protein
MFLNIGKLLNYSKIMMQKYLKYINYQKNISIHRNLHGQ